MESVGVSCPNDAEGVLVLAVRMARRVCWCRCPNDAESVLVLGVRMTRRVCGSGSSSASGRVRTS